MKSLIYVTMSPYLFAIYIDSVFEKVAATRVGCHVQWACASILYADDILLLAPTVSALQHLLNVCQSELQYLDMAINARSMSAPSQYKQPCSNLLTSDNHEIVWCENVRYLGVHVVSSKSFTCSLSNAKRSFYRSFNAIFGRVGHIATQAVIVELLNSKCLPTLLYSLRLRSMSFEIC